MSNRTVFQELSRFMPDKEREALLDKLKQSVHAESDERDLRLHREVDDREREQRIEKDIGELSLFAWLFLWLRSKFAAKPLKDAFVSMRLKMLKRQISSRYPGITGFETRDLNPKFAEEIFRVYSVAVALRKHYQGVWTQPLDLQNMIVGVLESRIPNVKRQVTELVSMNTLEEISRATGSREALREEIGRRLNDYFKKIPNSVFTTLQEDMKPFERTRDIVLYPYASFFQLFHFTPSGTDGDEKTYFKSASAMLCLEHLEQLHYALYSVSTIPSHAQISDDILAYLRIRNDEEDAPGGSVPADSSFSPAGPMEEIEEDVPVAEEEGGSGDQKVRESLARVIDRSRVAYQKLPFEALIRYFLKDPYYDLVHTFSETSVKDLYISVLRLRCMAELEQLYPELRKRVVEKEIQELFSGKTLRTFRNYREYKSLDYRKLGLPFFRHTRSVVLLYNYVYWFYKAYIQEVVGLLDRNVLGQNRITRDRLVQYAQSVEDTAERVRQFDYSLSTDSEDGRMFHRLRFTLAQDPSHQKMYRALVVQKDREVQNIVERGTEALNGLLRVFDDLLQSSSPNIQTSMQNHYFMKGQPVSLTEIVQERIDHIRKFVQLLDQVVKLERG